jgi:TatD DNase family protein
MTGLFDTHSHLSLEPLCGDLEGVLERAFTAGVERILVPSISADSWDACSELTVLPGISCALGVHPWWAEDGVNIDELRQGLKESGAVALGEIGLDWKTEVPRQKQYRIFQEQVELASAMDIPVVLHCRNAFEEMLRLLEKHRVRGVIHAWSRGPQLMKRFLDAGLYISFGGTVTRHRALKVHESARLVPMNRFVLETDSPSMGLAGVPAGRSEPQHIIPVTEAFAQIREQSLEEIRQAAWNNSVELFGEDD